MDRSVVWIDAAIGDVEAIAAFIARDSETYAAGLVQRFLASARSLSEYPEMGRSVPEWSDASVRELIIGSYRLIYWVRQSDIVVIAVIHAARLLPDSLKRHL